MTETIRPRGFQERFINAAIERARSGEKVTVANVHPGSGKTLAVLMAANELRRAGVIDQVAVFVPRLNLAAQFEHDWKDARGKLEGGAVLGQIDHRNNNPPLIRGQADGYVTTYDSLVSFPELHLKEVAKRRTLVVFDEAQQLGIDYDGISTQSARWAAELGKRAQLVFVMSGTPYRADGSPLLFAEYGDPDASGWRPLLAHVEATYLDGVRDGYLRPFEAVLHDGVSVWQGMGTEPQELVLSETEQGIYRIICEDGYWKPLVDRFVEKLKEQRELVYDGFCGLIAANNQEHAKDIKHYLSKKHAGLEALIAISDDGKEAHKSLREFREGRADVLVTVNMAYVGYDYKPINVILPLTSYRTAGYLRQLVARGLRMMPGVDPNQQVCNLVAPNDPRMRAFVDELRRESAAGVYIRDNEKRLSNGSGTQFEFGASLDAWMTTIRAMGIDPTGDLTPLDYQIAEKLRQEMRIGAPVTQLIAFSRSWNGRSIEQAPVRVTTAYTPTEQEKEAASRSTLKKLASKCDYDLADGKFGTTNLKLKIRYHGKGAPECTREEIEQRIMLVERWLEQGHYD